MKATQLQCLAWKRIRAPNKTSRTFGGGSKCSEQFCEARCCTPYRKLSIESRLFLQLATASNISSPTDWRSCFNTSSPTRKELHSEEHYSQREFASKRSRSWPYKQNKPSCRKRPLHCFPCYTQKWKEINEVFFLDLLLTGRCIRRSTSLLGPAKSIRWQICKRLGCLLPCCAFKGLQPAERPG